MSDDYGKHTSWHDPVTVPVEIYIGRVKALQTDNDKLLSALQIARKWMPNSRVPTVNEEEAYAIIDEAIAKALDERRTRL